MREMFAYAALVQELCAEMVSGAFFAKSVQDQRPKRSYIRIPGHWRNTCGRSMNHPEVVKSTAGLLDAAKF